MMTYKTLAENIQEKAKISFDETLVTIAVAFKAMAEQLARHEVAILRKNVAPELKQLLDRSRNVHGQASQIIGVVATSLEIAHTEAKRRLLILLEELREGVSLASLHEATHNAEFLEIIDRLRDEISGVLVQVAVQVA